MDGLVIYHLTAGMEEVVDMENDLSDRLEDFAQKLEDSPSNIYWNSSQANIQRTKVIQDQVSESKDNCKIIFELNTSPRFISR